MLGLRQEILPPSGVEFAKCMRLTHSTLNSNSRQKVVCNLVVARNNYLRIFEIVEEQGGVSGNAEGSASEPVPGEMEMDSHGDGFINVTELRTAVRAPPQTVPKLRLVREHRLYGIVTGLDQVQTIATTEDGLDRLLVSFKDAKIALMEWSEVVYDLMTVSIHTYERATQVITNNNPHFRSLLRVDPLYRCAALLLPLNGLALLPFFQTQAELDIIDQEQNVTSLAKEAPYSPSFVLDLPVNVDSRIKQVIDIAFLPGFNNPTLAVLYQSEFTTTGRLHEARDTVSLLTITLDVLTRTYPVISHTPSLPHDSQTLSPCHPSIGGVLVTTPNGILQVDQGGGIVGCASNHWFSRVSNVPNVAPPDQPNSEGFDMDNSFVEWIGTEPCLFLPNGSIRTVRIEREGRVVHFGPEVGRVARPERGSVCPVGERILFVGSLDGEAGLARVVRGTAEVQEEESDEEMEDEDDLYGDTTGQTQAKSGAALQPITGFVLADTLPAYGGINAMVFALAKNGDRYAPELIACTGAEYTGGFSLFQKDLPTRIKRKVPAIGGARGVWSIALRRSHAQDLDTVVVSTDLAPSPGISRIAKAAGNEVQILARTPGLTMAAGAFFQQTCVAQITTNSIRLLEPDGAERQLYLDAEGNKPRPKIKAAHVADPFIVVLREDDTFGLFVGDTTKGRVRRKDVSHFGENGTICSSASFFTDHTDLFHIRKPGDAVPTQPGGGSNRRRGGEPSSSKRRASRKSRGGPVAPTTLENIVDADHGTQWLVVLRKNGTFEIWTLPLIGLAFSTDQLQALPDILVDSGQTHTAPRPEGESDIEHVVVAPIGITRPKPHLIVITKSRTLAVYEPVTAPLPTESSNNPTPVRDQLVIQFVKVFSRVLPLDTHDTKRVAGRALVPFKSANMSGVFVTGDHPFWLLRTDTSPLRTHPHAAQYVNSFTPCSIFEKGEYLVHSDEGATIVEWLPDVDIGPEIPCRSYASDDGRVYTSVAYDVSTRHVLAASALRTTFAYYDEDANEIYTPDAAHPNPQIHCSALELITPDTWTTVDGYEFAQNEFINAVESIPLETLSTERGLKDYVVVGTTISRGEDLAVKGATYVFEVVEVVPEPGIKTRQYRLRLLCREDSKGAVTALCGINGYLVSSMGQKIFVRAFDLDEKLTGIAFMDVGVCVTSLRPLKNLLLIGDMLKSVWFVAFQEEPFKLVPLGKDRQQLSVTHANFFFGPQGQLSFAASDDLGVLRMYEYNPHHPDSDSGSRLICSSEFHTHVPHRDVLAISRKVDSASVPDAMDIQSLGVESSLITGLSDGSIASLMPLNESEFSRLQLLQGQLIRNVQHIAGLNPKAHRYVKNDFVSRSLSNGVLDGNLLAAFEELPVAKQVEMTQQIGAEREKILNDLLKLRSPW
ncbi:cleavage and polyadenylation specificity factor protein [Rhizoctonia solani 123E]|uniref:Cleavage and polyadenylation specificity factor protein n=1 Tax=Rhizoctonia solani 123E TaxID=1423351 RepID=A0A074RXF2_9AGAM|nr:cleavage and polyadenylation specificity factor protein [Rhizoctonia solani 123E]